MNAQQQQNSNDVKGKLPDEPEQHRVAALVLFEATRFNHSDTVTVSAKPGETGGVNIVPALVLPNGDWRQCIERERCDGFGLAQWRGSGKDRRLVRGFLTWSAIKEIVYDV